MNRKAQSPAKSSAAVAVALAALLTMAAPASAGLPEGEVSGWVSDERGIPQMGALVAVLNPDGRLARRVFTDHSGAFRAEGLFPGKYAVKVTLGRFLPIAREGIEVRSGIKTVLDVKLRSLFASLHLAFPGGGEIRDMTDEWKWTLRAAHASRPALRLVDNQQRRETQRLLRKISGAFTDTRAYAEVSGGAGMTSSGLANQSDLGTAFAVATSLFGDNNFKVAGNVGYSAVAQSPTSAFRTSFQRDLGLGSPEVSVTVRQLQTAVAGRSFLDPHQTGEAPELQTFTLGLGDRIELSDSTTFEYGFLYESVNFLNRLDYVSPYGKLIQQISPRRKVILRYASGAPRPDPGVQGSEQLRQEVSALGMFPRVALRDGDATVQRTEHMEIAFSEQVGRGLIEAAIYQDVVSDAAMSAFVPNDYYVGGQVLPDLFSHTSTLNGGRHVMRGYRISYARKIKDRLEAALGYGSGGVVGPRDARQLRTDDLSELRDRMGVEQAHMVVASLSAELPGSDTRLVSSYQWSSRDSALAPDLYNEFASRSDPGLNIIVRQPLPFGEGLTGKGKFELTADIRNLLQAGYIPIQGHDGRTIYLMQAIRSYRGSLSFVF